MKRLLVVITVLALFLGLLAGCQSNTEPEEKAFKVELEGNATTGFEWTYTMDPDGIVEEIFSEYLTEETEEDMVGVGGTYIFEFRGVEQGDVTLTFRYARSWEDVEPEQVVSYELHVDEDGNITAK